MLLLIQIQYNDHGFMSTHGLIANNRLTFLPPSDQQGRPYRAISRKKHVQGCMALVRKHLGNNVFFLFCGEPFPELLRPPSGKML